MKANEIFRLFSKKVSDFVGSTYAFIAASAFIVLWLLTGPLFQFSDSWQLVVNTLTTVVTFLMVFIIQNSQNRDSKAFHLKLDELIKGVKGARNELVDLENLSDEELEKIHQEFKILHEQTIKKMSDIEHSKNKRKKKMN